MAYSKIFTTFLLTALILFVKADSDLLSARCQSRCLAELESRIKDNPDLRRQLKHQTVNLCKDDAKCSSCTIPCREAAPTDPAAVCASTLCQSPDIKSPEACNSSCAFIVDSYRNRPGSCPAEIPVKLDECSAACNRDGDCPGSEKCCTSGCSRVCIASIITDSRLLPTPEGISVQERKRKRSAVVRWVMKRLSRAHMATNANLYVLQWRWGVRKEMEGMTPWQTITVKNKMYAILKHLLLPGRYYVFRVAAINQYGTFGFSKPSVPFKLSKEVRAPSAPKNLTIEQLVFDETTSKWVPKLTWTPPSSDLPIKDYQLSWWRSSYEFANAYEQRSTGGSGAIAEAQSARRRSASLTDEGDEDYTAVDDSMEKNQKSSTIVPSYATKTQLNDGLESERVYMVEMFATVDSAEGELRGEPAVLFIRTNSPNMVINDAESVRYEVDLLPDASTTSKAAVSTTSKPTTSTSPASKKPQSDLLISINDETSNELIYSLDIQTPFYADSSLQTKASWLDSPACSADRNIFAVRVTPRNCKKSAHSTRIITVTQCVVSLTSLEFDCEYELEVDSVQSRRVVAKAFFKTQPCISTPSSETLPCPVPPSLKPKCKITSQTPISAICEWPSDLTAFAEAKIIGFRTILSSSESTAVGVASTHSPRMVYDNLLPATDYRFRLQPVTDGGLGNPVDVEFTTPGATASADLNNHPKRLDRFPILELPLESSSAASTPTLAVIVVLLSCLLRG
uniref:WAP domain-containing protein n=1 Tax=Panagrellus redivivus TaxID=6233 RepID=A0A7E4VDE7_PANRE